MRVEGLIFLFENSPFIIIKNKTLICRTKASKRMFMTILLVWLVAVHFYRFRAVNDGGFELARQLREDSGELARVA